MGGSSNVSGIDGVSCKDCIFGNFTGALGQEIDKGSCYLKPPTVVSVGGSETGLYEESVRPSIESKGFCAQGIQRDTRKRFIEIIQISPN